VASSAFLTVTVSSATVALPAPLALDGAAA
jgi:hypothetical protein